MTDPTHSGPSGLWREARGILAAGLALILIVWVAVGFYALNDRRETVDQVRSENAFIASAFEEHARRILRTADTALRFLQQGMEAHGAVTADMQAFAGMTLRDLEALQVGVSDAAGNLVYSAVPLKVPLNVADREHFQVHLARPDVGLHVARPVMLKATSTWAFFVTRRFNRPDGSFGGVVTIGLDPAYFGKVYGNLRIGQDRAGLLVGTDHYTRVRINGETDKVGDDISGYSPVFREAAQRPVGAYRLAADQAGNARLASYRVMPDYPLIVVVSALEDEVLGPWGGRLRADVAGALAFGVLAALATLALAGARTQARRRDAEARALQERLVQAQKLQAIGALAGGVAHDFNNMLGVILGCAELALLDAPPDGPLRGHLDEIREAAQRSAGITRQLLAFARRQPAAPRVLDAAARIEGLLPVLRRLLGERVALRWSPGAGGWPVLVDPGQLDQVLTNLVTNARDAIRGPGVVTVRTANVAVDAATAALHPGTSPGDHLAITVEDTGEGIDPAHLPSIFEPFFTTKATGKGTGLGLATVFGIVDQNGGFVAVRSRVGEGSAFVVHLPRAAGVAAVEAPAAVPPPPPGPAGAAGTVLLVEDERAHLDLVRRMLERAGFRVLAAPDPLEALRLAEAEPGRIDLVLTDVVMPHLDGRALVERLRAGRAGLRCLYMSGWPADVLGSAAGAGADQAYLQKPFTVAQLHEAIDRALAGP